MSNYLLQFSNFILVPSYTLCWDNTQIDVKARHQGKDHNVWQKIWALCYAAVNRVHTGVLADDPPLTTVVEMPLRLFLPDAAHNVVLRRWLAFEMKQSLVKFLPVFNGLRLPSFIEHDHWVEMKQKSEVVGFTIINLLILVFSNYSNWIVCIKLSQCDS
jgi:hypothetical protein